MQQKMTGLLPVTCKIVDKNRTGCVRVDTHIILVCLWPSIYFLSVSIFKTVFTKTGNVIHLVRHQSQPYHNTVRHWPQVPRVKEKLICKYNGASKTLNATR